MTQGASSLSARAFAGLLVLLPLAIIFLAVMEIHDLLEETAAFAQLDLPFPGFINALIYLAAVLAGLFLFCLLVGLFLETGLGKRFAELVEKGIADRIPLLGLVRSLTLSIGGAGESALQAVEVDLQGNGASVLGLLMESLEDGRQVVFVPGSPAVTLGTVHIVPADRIKLLEVGVGSVANAISQWGVGTRDVLHRGAGDSGGA